MKTILSERLKELGLKKYELAKRLAKSEGKQPHQIATRVAQTINEPENRKYCNVVDVIHALGGEIIVRWTNVDERIASWTKLPGYWLPSEIAEKLKKSTRWVLHHINGRDGHAPDLFAYQVKRLYFIPDDQAIAFIERYRGKV